jgi:hypothetical protein
MFIPVWRRVRYRTDETGGDFRGDGDAAVVFHKAGAFAALVACLKTL